MAFYALFLAYAILRFQFLAIEIVIKKSIGYSILIAIISIAYLVIVVATERLLQSYIQYQSIAFTILAAFLIGILFIPLRNRIQSLVDRLFFRKSPAEIAEENKLLRHEVADKEKSKAVATLASGIAHDIRGPLTAIKTFFEHFPQKKDDPQFIEKFQAIVGKEIHRIENLTTELLEFAKPSSLNLEDTDINALIDETLDLLNNQLQKCRIQVNRILGAAGPRLKADQNKLKQVLINIILNARDAMPNGGNLTISTQLSAIGSQTSAKPLKTDGCLLITIKDTGCGIDAKELTHIFEPFYTKKEKGTGLGLAIVQGIVEEHGGKISVKSKLGAGTEFILEFLVSAKD